MPNSNQKGKRGERELAAYLTERGFTAERGKQYQGGHDSPDVRCPRLNAMGINIECKRVEQLSIHKAMEQAVADAGENMAVVMHRRNGTEWLATMRLDDWLEMVNKQEGAT